MTRYHLSLTFCPPFSGPPVVASVQACMLPCLDHCSSLFLTGLSYSSFVSLQILHMKVMDLKDLYDRVNSFHGFQCLERTSKPYAKPFRDWPISLSLIQWFSTSFASQWTVDNVCVTFLIVTMVVRVCFWCLVDRGQGCILQCTGHLLQQRSLESKMSIVLWLRNLPLI